MTAGTRILDLPLAGLRWLVAHRLFVRVYLTARLLLVVGLELYIVGLLTRYHAEAVMGREKIIASQRASDKARIEDALNLRVTITDFELRTVTRWKQLQTDNPGLKVPLVIEPLTGPDPGIPTAPEIIAPTPTPTPDP